MKNRAKFTAALALALGLAASPSIAQDFYGNGANRFGGSASDSRDGTLNVWGARVDPVRPGRGLLGGLVGGVTGTVGGVVGGTVGAAGDVATGSVAPRRLDAAGRPSYSAY